MLDRNIGPWWGFLWYSLVGILVQLNNGERFLGNIGRIGEERLDGNAEEVWRGPI